MTYLLDVNALVALGFANHEFHQRIAAWVRGQRPSLATCSITELGFARALSQAPAYGLTIAHARTLLQRIQRANASRFTFISDAHDLSHLPAWVRTAKQITAGHLLELARENGGVLATLDGGIPGTYLIPG